jgi:hypothetical protein
MCVRSLRVCSTTQGWIEASSRKGRIIARDVPSCAPFMLREINLSRMKSPGSLKGNWFQRACLTLVSFRRNDDRNHIDERQLNGVE